MRRYSAILVICLSICMALQAGPNGYLKGRLPERNGRRATFVEALRLLEARGVQTIVETGTERFKDPRQCFPGDGGSTIIFGHWAFDHQAAMYSVDINRTHIAYARANTIPYHDYLTFVHADSVTFLNQFRDKIDFLYLDSYDYDVNNPGPAQRHCLAEICAAEDKLTARSIVMIDDCNVPRGGKGKLAIAYLLSKGWYLHRNRHQVILLHH